MQYRPVTALPREWDRIAEFARQAVLDYGPSNATVGLRMLSTVAHYIFWAMKEEHVPLDRDELFHPTLLGRYIRSRAPKKNSSLHKTLHSLLFRVASAVTDVDHNRKKRGRISHDVVPYSATELAELESWAIARKNSTHRRYAKTFLALSGGAGLQSVECTHVRGRDILRTADGYSVRVTGRYPRVVPVQSEWTNYLDDAIEAFVDDEPVLFPGQADEVRPRTLKWFCVGEHPAPFAQRLRDTWVLSQLPVLPLGVLMHAAGMPDIQTLRRYLPRVPTSDLAGWDKVLRQPSAHIRPAACIPELPTSRLGSEVEGRSRPHAPAADETGARVDIDTTLRLDQTAVPAGTPMAPVPSRAELASPERSSIRALEAECMPKQLGNSSTRKGPSTSRYLRQPPTVGGSETFTDLKQQLQDRRSQKDGGDLR